MYSSSAISIAAAASSPSAKKWRSHAGGLTCIQHDSNRQTTANMLNSLLFHVCVVDTINWGYSCRFVVWNTLISFSVTCASVIRINCDYSYSLGSCFEFKLQSSCGEHYLAPAVFEFVARKSNSLFVRRQVGSCRRPLR